MIREVKTFEFHCDRCRERTAITHGQRAELPAGWTIVQVHGCGMTGYTRSDHVCPHCSKS